MSRHFYGFDFTYGPGTTDSKGRWIGNLSIFDSKSERDAWISEEGKYRYPITSREARVQMISNLSAYYDPRDVDFDSDTWEEISKSMSMDSLVKAWRKLDKDLEDQQPLTEEEQREIDTYFEKLDEKFDLCF